MRRVGKLLFFMGLLLTPLFCWARLGGGGHFSGSGSYSGGYGGSSGGGSAVFELIQLLFMVDRQNPALGIPITLLLIFAVIWIATHSEKGNSFHSEDPASGGLAPVSLSSRLEVEKRLEDLRTVSDPNFSEPMFLDFCTGLFSVIHQARGKKLLDSYSGYLSDQARTTLKSLTSGLVDVEGVIVGGIQIAAVSDIHKVIEVDGAATGEGTRILVHFESNYTETIATGTDKRTQTQYSREEWIFSRKKGIQSRAPDKIRAFNCPACGAPVQGTSDGKCAACGNIIQSGNHDWYVVGIECHREKRPDLLTTEVEEQSTSFPTIFDPSLAQQQQTFNQLHAQFNWDEFRNHVLRIFVELQRAWSDRTWEKARPYETDALFQSHYYWIQEYKRQHLINVIDQISQLDAIVVKIQRDRYFDAVTLRVSACSTDYTRRDDKNEVVVGNPKQLRKFTEYWTVIRGRTPKPRKSTDFFGCPSCGAPLKINMMGYCEYCKTLVSSGDFDWVLSRIEQDQAYSG